MDIKAHKIKEIEVAEIISDTILIRNTEDALDLLGNVYYQGFNHVVIYEKNLSADFFDLKNKMAGDILQKFSNYRVRLFIVGDFKKFTSTSLKDFIYESNQGKHVNFVANIADALQCFE
ncbi:DUF4180 domain-containing protein [Sphingobacterium sp. UT-1RO-CII-1]|uniref:DUF4180 domain-containing protein n=1 Tax=Sphingobacterium sp. UT-1RO-CII-1 TaxID=2995225 RepID=UPI00227BF1D0|nr:DUF4180 domain-containing protein [Sphingobacterium sp. UT-1RO-CII-1]MCY4780394.1 DUF4180 domain-containing protein [Sphingobacterium sp. UT-1RO-CII-1]